MYDPHDVVPVSYNIQCNYYILDDMFLGFDELRCHCGHSVVYPPVPCNTPVPECKQLCAREHRCRHPVTHPCHSEPVCPPCTSLTEKKCHGGHELRRNIPCHLDVSCSLLNIKYIVVLQRPKEKNNNLCSTMKTYFRLLNFVEKNIRFTNNALGLSEAMNLNTY